MAIWKVLEDEYERSRQTVGRLYAESRKARCPFVLAQYGHPVSDSPSLQCVKDRHGDGGHELGGEAWVEKGN